MFSRFKIFSIIFSLLLLITVSFTSLQALALVSLSDSTINEAIEQGLRTKKLGLSELLDGNWKEGANGALLNIYTPYMDIAKSVRHLDMTNDPSAEDVKKARKKIHKDLDYIWTHQTVKFIVSLYGDNSGFAKNYYAVIEGFGRGQNFTLYPDKTVQQYLANKEGDVKDSPFTAVNTYTYNFDKIAPMDEFTFKLYGKGIQPVLFKVVSSRIN